MSIIADKPHNTLWDDANFSTARKPAPVPTLSSQQYITLIRRNHRDPVEQPQHAH